MTKKIIFSLLFFIIIAVVFLTGIYFFLTAQPDNSKVAEVIIEEKTSDNSTPKQVSESKVKSGTFNYLDPLHNGAGDVEIFDMGDKYKIKFATNFKSADAPDPYVYLSSAQDFKDRAVGGVDTSKTINIGKLKNFSGEQEYFVSKNDFEAHDAAVVVWCKKFGVQISRADLK